MQRAAYNTAWDCWKRIVYSYICAIFPVRYWVRADQSTSGTAFNPPWLLPLLVYYFSNHLYRCTTDDSQQVMFLLLSNRFYVFIVLFCVTKIYTGSDFISYYSFAHDERSPLFCILLQICVLFSLLACNGNVNNLTPVFWKEIYFLFFILVNILQVQWV